MVDAVRDFGTAEGFLQSAGLHIGAVEDGEGAVIQLLADVCLLDRFGYHAALLLLVGGAEQGYAVALGIVRPNLLLNLFDVLGNDGVGGIDDDLGGAVVLLQFEKVKVGVVTAEVEDVLYVGTAEGVDALGVVAHHADVLQPRGELLDNEVLRVVGVLILVHHDVFEAVLIFEQHVGVVAQQDVHIEKEVVEVHRHSVAKAVIVELVNLGNHGLVGILVGLLDFGVVGVILRREEVALGHRDATHHIAGAVGLGVEGAVGLGVEVEVLDNLLESRFAVVVVIDGEGVDVANPLRLGTQNAGEDGVEGAHPDVAGLAAYQLHDTLLHLGCRLVGEGEGKDVKGVDPQVDEMGYAIGQRARLATARAGNNHHRPFGAGGSLALRFIQLGKYIFGTHCCSVSGSQLISSP